LAGWAGEFQLEAHGANRIDHTGHDHGRGDDKRDDCVGARSSGIDGYRDNSRRIYRAHRRKSTRVDGAR